MTIDLVHGSLLSEIGQVAESEVPGLTFNFRHRPMESGKYFLETEGITDVAQSAAVVAAIERTARQKGILLKRTVIRPA